MAKEDSYIESIEDAGYFLKQLHLFLASENCQLDIQRKRKDEDPLDPNSTINTILDLNYNEADIKEEILALTLRDYIKTVKDIKRAGSPDYRIFSKQINNRDIYIKLKINSLNRIHLMSFHYAIHDLEDKPYK